MIKFISSPAKLMRSEAPEHIILKPTAPKFISQAEFLNAKLKQLRPIDLQEMMEISPKLADENWQRNQDWKSEPKKLGISAGYAFTGEVYRGLDILSLDEKAVAYLQKHLYILSGLYGILRPLDKILPYRLEMGRTFPDGLSLYEFWHDTLLEFFSELPKNTILVNLASQEYAKVIPWKSLPIRKIDIEFKEIKNGKPTTVAVYAKNARGRMLRFAAEQEIKKHSELKSFSEDGYLFSEELSKDDVYVFTR